MFQDYHDHVSLLLLVGVILLLFLLKKGLLGINITLSTTHLRIQLQCVYTDINLAVETNSLL